MHNRMLSCVPLTPLFHNVFKKTMAKVAERCLARHAFATQALQTGRREMLQM